MERRGCWLFFGVNIAAVLVGIGAFLLYHSLQPVPGSDTHFEGTVAQTRRL